MRRREFITMLGGVASPVLWPLGARAQRPERMRLIGVLMGYSENDSEGQAQIAAFRDGLRKLGWTEGSNIRIDTRWATPTDAAAMQRFAKELVALQPEVILASTTPTTTALLEQTRTIPVVFATVGDPIGSGFVASFPRPGGNVTGFITVEGSLGGKWLELLKEIAPRVNRVAFLLNPATATYAESYLNAFKAAAASVAVEAIVAPVHDRSEFDTVIAAQAREPNSGLIVIADAFTVAYRVEITSLAARYRLPAIYPFRLFVEVGGLLSYGADLTDNFRTAATYVDRILKGEKPSELPVQAPVKFELAINLKTAKALGLDVPLLLQQRADAVIE
jgi:putative tryptophan/tyrosine transport system substrate-binding protein